MSEKKEKLMPNVSVKQCIGTILFSIFAACLVFIPLTFGSLPISFTYEYLPFVGNGKLLQAPMTILAGVSSMFKLEQNLIEYVGIVLNLTPVVFFSILIFNIVSSLLLAILRFSFLRVIFKIISIICGFLMIVITLSNLLFIVGFCGNFISGSAPIENIMNELETSRILLAISMLVLSSMLIKKQFVWFAKLY